MASEHVIITIMNIVMQRPIYEDNYVTAWKWDQYWTSWRY